MRLIDADAIINILDAVILEAYWQALNISVTTDTEQWININFVKSIIERASTVEAEPIKHGRWIKHDNRDCWFCSECGADDYYAFVYQDHYCPNCGALMDKEGE